MGNRESSCAAAFSTSACLLRMILLREPFEVCFEACHEARRRRAVLLEGRLRVSCGLEPDPKGEDIWGAVRAVTVRVIRAVVGG